MGKQIILGIKEEKCEHSQHHLSFWRESCPFFSDISHTKERAWDFLYGTVPDMIGVREAPPKMRCAFTRHRISTD